MPSSQIHQASPFSFLLVDDNERDRYLIKRILDRNFESGSIEEALNCREAIQKSRTGKYDFIFLDLGLPDMDGMEALKQFLLSPDSETKIIVVSGREDSETIAQILENGAQDYVSKTELDDVSLLRAMKMSTLRKHNSSIISGSSRISIQALSESAFITSLNGSVLDCNDRASTHLELMPGTNILEYNSSVQMREMDFGQPTHLKRLIQKKRAHQQVKSYLTVVGSTGKTRLVESSQSLIQVHGEPCILFLVRELSNNEGPSSWNSSDSRRSHIKALELQNRLLRKPLADMDSMLAEIFDSEITPVFRESITGIQNRVQEIKQGVRLLQDLGEAYASQLEIEEFELQELVSHLNIKLISSFCGIDCEVSESALPDEAILLDFNTTVELLRSILNLALYLQNKESCSRQDQILFSVTDNSLLIDFITGYPLYDFLQELDGASISSSSSAWKPTEFNLLKSNLLLFSELLRKLNGQLSTKQSESEPFRMNLSLPFAREKSRAITVQAAQSSMEISEQFALIVEDNLTDQMLLKRLLSRVYPELTIKTAATLKECRKLLKLQDFSLVFLDYKLPDGSGADLLRSVQQITKDCCLIAVTGDDREQTVEELLSLGASDTLYKGELDLHSLKKSIQAARLRKSFSKERDSLLENAFRNSNDGIIVCDQGEKILLANPKACLELNAQSQELVGQGIAQIFPETSELALHDKEFHQVRVTMKDLSGRTFPAQLTINSIPSNRILLQFRDLSDQEELEKTLTQTNETMKTFNRATAHDLRSPLSTIRSLSSIIIEDENNSLTEQSKRCLALQDQVVENLTSLVERLLSYSKVDGHAGHPEVVSLEESFQRVLDNLSYTLEEEGIEVRVAMMDKVFIDPMQLQMVFQNLLENSIRYRRDNHKALIEVSSEALANGMVEIVFQDNGEGFDPALASNLFEPFRRFSRKANTGNGLGLATVKKIIQSSGGKIKATSPDEFGATFTIVLPASIQ